MGAFLFYLIKSEICLVMLYLLFRFLMSRTTFFRLNRLTIIIGMVCCATLPLMEITTEQPTLYHSLQSVRSLLDDAYPQTMPLASNEVAGDEAGTIAMVGDAQTRWVPLVIGGFYLLGAGVVLVWLAVSTFRMWTFIRQSESIPYKNYKLIITDRPVSSFSWGRYIVISRTDYSFYADEILRHEMMHLRHHHTLDLIFLQLFLVLHWFNPAVWLLKRELQEVHEYEADNGVLNTGIDATRYQLLLVKKAVGTRLYSMANGFNHSKLKNRIIMMLKERTNRWARLKLLLCVPVVAGTLYAFAQPEVKEVLQQVTPEMQQGKSDDYVSLMNRFEKEYDAYLIRVYGTTNPRKMDVKKSQVHQLLVNANNRILFDNDYLNEANDLKSAIKTNLLKNWEKSNRKEVQTIYFNYDRGADMDAITKILKDAESAFEEIRADLSAASGNQSKESLDKLFPILLLEAAPKEFGLKPLAKEEKVTGVKVTIHTSNGTETFENFTLDELAQKVTAARAKTSDPDALVVGLKMDKNCKMGIVTDVKNVLRKASVTKLNMN